MANGNYGADSIRPQAQGDRLLQMDRLANPLAPTADVNLHFGAQP